MTRMSKISLSKINPSAMYSARKVFTMYETPFSHAMQFNNFLLADSKYENRLQAIINKTQTKRKYLIQGQKLLEVLPTLTKEEIVETIAKYESDNQA